MSKLQWSFLALYLAAAAGYGGWRGPDLWSGWGAAWLVLPPLAWAAQIVFAEWRRNRHWGTVKIALVMTAAGVVALGAAALGLAWVVAEASASWSAVPAVRALAAVGLLAAAGALAWAGRASGKPAEPRGADGSEGAGRPAEPGAAPDRGR
jgi:hypothetical protein